MEMNEHLAVFLEISTQFESVLISHAELYQNILSTLVEEEYLLLTDLEACCPDNMVSICGLMTWLEHELEENSNQEERHNILEIIYTAVVELQAELESCGEEDDLEIFQPIE